MRGQNSDRDLERLRAFRQFTAADRDETHLVTAGNQPAHGEQRLALAAAPLLFEVNVDDFQGAGCRAALAALFARAVPFESWASF